MGNFAKNLDLTNRVRPSPPPRGVIILKGLAMISYFKFHFFKFSTLADNL